MKRLADTSVAGTDLSLLFDNDLYRSVGYRQSDERKIKQGCQSV